jgi:hypothetical protein
MKSRITAMASLLLYRDTDQNGVLYVLNPATQRRARLPPCSGEDWQRPAFLVFDPAVSPHYKVLLEPLERIDQAAHSRLMEWPPPAWSWGEFSSRTGRWKEKVLARQGEAAATVGELLLGLDLGYSMVLATSKG